MKMSLNQQFSRFFIAVIKFGRGRWAEVLTVTLLAIMTAQMLAIIARKSITNDEVVSIPAGYYHLARGSFEIGIDHPPIAKMWAALPLILIQPNTPPIPAIQNAGERTLATQDEFWRANKDRFRQISFLGRLPAIVLTNVLGVLIFVYARQLFTAVAAVIAVALFSVEPTVLAHGRTALNDLPAAFAYLFFTFMAYKFLKAPDSLRAFMLGLATALALLTKFSLIIVVPILFVVVIVSIWKTRAQTRKRIALQIGFAFITALLLVNLGYYFQRPAPEELEYTWLRHTFPSPTAFAALKMASKLVPSYFFEGIDAVMWRNRYGQPASLLGMHSSLGWRYYFPIAFALKTTIPFLLISLMAVPWSLRELLKFRESRLVVLWAPFAIYVVLALTSTINIGIRHLLPAFPFLFIFSGAFLDRLLRWKRARPALLLMLVMMLAWCGAEAVRAFPNHMTYFNEFASRHPHWYYLSDSNVEWGDDIPELAEYLRGRGETSVRAALLGGWVTLPYYGVQYIDAHVPPGTPVPETRYIAIGASFLNGSTVTFTKPGRRREDYFDEYRARTPEMVFGGSIYLFREK